jgi:hypothetical protein
MKSLLGLSRSLLHDLKRLHPDVNDLDRDLLTIEARIEDEGDSFVTVALPAYGKALDQSLARGKMASVPGFSRHGQIPRLFSGIARHIFDSKTGDLRSDASIDAIVSMRQALYFFKKFCPSDDRVSHLDFQARRDFQTVDTDLHYENDADNFGSRVQLFGRVARNVLQGLDFVQEHTGRHGPGAVMEGYTANQKWKAVHRGLLEFDRRLCLIGYDLPASLLAESLLQAESLHDDLSRTCARLVTVPKTCTALRTITVEPCINQFVQQGLNSTLREHIAKDPILGLCLTLDSQVPNQDLALEGSLTSDWCTLDLSSASDRLSLQVVELAFAHTPRFLHALLASRTPDVKIDGFSVITLKKYAGMGNATTFPVQSVVFALLAICGVLEQRGRGQRVPTQEEIRGAARCVRVFGDDIIVRRDHVQCVVDWIESFGLKINLGKTFTEGNFRESCGTDAFRGYDVSPVYLRRDPELAATDPSSFVSLVATANQLWLRGYYETADFLKDICSRVRTLPLVPEDSGGLGWHTRQNCTTIQRWNRDLHRFEYRTYVPRGLTQEDDLDGEPALLKFFHMPRLAEYDKKHLRDSALRYSTKLSKQWMPAR